MSTKPNKSSYLEFILESLLLEMPHIVVSDGSETKAFDIETEVHLKQSPSEFIAYIQSWVDGNPIQSKTPGFVMKVPKELIPQFAKKLLNNDQFQMIVKRFYSEDVWAQIASILSNKEF